MSTMKFRVTAHMETWPYGRPRNPFRCSINNFPKMHIVTREWTFEAENEAEVRRFWDEAQRQCLDNVAGFVLGRIEKIEGCAEKESALSTTCGTGYVSVAEWEPTIALLKAVAADFPEENEDVHKELARLEALKGGKA